MSNLTNLCLNRLDRDPYLHRIIPYLTHFTQDHPGQKLIVLSDKELLTKGLYLSLKENEIPVQLYSQYQAIPLNVLNGTQEEVFQRLLRLGLLTQESPQSGTEALFNQTSYLALTHALTIIKTVKGNLATLHDLTTFLNSPTYQQNASHLISKFQQMPVSTEWQRQQHLEAMNWFLYDYFPSTSKKQLHYPTFEYAALGRLKLEQFEREWGQLFPKQGGEHRLNLWLQPEVTIIDVHHLNQVKHAVVTYLIEILSQSNVKNKTIHVFCDLTQPLSDEQWSELLLNHELEITQTQHLPKDSLTIDTLYDTRSVKFLQYYNISNKPALLQAIQQFKAPGQASYEKQCQIETLRREKVLRATPTPSPRREGFDQSSVMDTDEIVDFSTLH